MATRSHRPLPRAPDVQHARPAADRCWSVPSELDGKPIDAAVRALAGGSWSEVRRFIESGKIFVGGEPVSSVVRRVRAGDSIELVLRAPRPKVTRRREIETDLIVYVDASIVVVNKPAGISTVPFEGEAAADEDRPREGETLDGLVREIIARRGAVRGRAPLGVVHRLDKQTSGLIVFARSLAAKKELGAQLRRHTTRRIYWAIAHGSVQSATFRSHLVADRGDGLRGSLRPTDRREGQLAVTHVEPRERLAGATWIICRLETGRTHQIRIHLSEAGHPIVGERVYVRGYAGPLLPAPRLMLHAAELDFEHPVDGRAMHFEQPPPPDFLETLRRLAGK